MFFNFSVHGKNSYDMKMKMKMKMKIFLRVSEHTNFSLRTQDTEYIANFQALPSFHFQVSSSKFQGIPS